MANNKKALLLRALVSFVMAHNPATEICHFFLVMWCSFQYSLVQIWSFLIHSIITVLWYEQTIRFLRCISNFGHSLLALLNIEQLQYCARTLALKKVKVGFFNSATHMVRNHESRALQSRKWQSTGKSQWCRSAVRAAKHTPQAAINELGLHPISIHQMLPPAWDSTHPITAYSFTDLGKMKGWVGLAGWPVADGLPTIAVTHQLHDERRTANVR